ncbi:MAG: nucleotidyltransferase family protein [Defluviitaleaceae bacterium]|nr:nucleotidyltransferase family protein [Defluviitaleaceae bacterium]
MKAIILAAGYATRMYPLTENTPKPLLPFRGSTVIDHIITQVNNIPGVDEIFVVTNSKFFSHFSQWAKTSESKAKISVLDDGTSSNETRRGAVGDVQFAIDERNIDDEIVVVAGDNFFTYDLREQYDVYRKTGFDTLCGKELDDAEKIKAFAVALLDESGKVIDLEEKPQKPKSNLAIYATYFFKRDTVPLIKKYLDDGGNADLIGAFPQWLYLRRDVHVYKMNGECYDIGTIEMYERLKEVNA